MTDDQLKSTIMEYVNGSDHPDLVVYRRDIPPNSLDHWLWRIGEYCELGNFNRKRILEAGCGFGWDAVGLAVKGQNQVVAMDILPSMVDGMTQCLESMKARNKPIDVTPKQGDICNVDLPNGSFHGIFSSEAVEHVHSLEQMFDRCFDLLLPGGKLVIANDSNRYNSTFRESTFEMWKERDESWPHAEWLKAEIRPVEHANAKPYFAMRETIIEEAESSLDPERRKGLAAATAGMIRPQIIEAAKTYVRDGALPTRPEFSWCRNPETGEYAERLLDPFEMRDMLRERGFSTKLRHFFRKFPHRLLNGVSFRPLNEKLFDMRAQFVLVATKPS